MSVDREDWQRFSDRKVEEVKSKGLDPTIRRAGEILEGKLTQSPEWNYFAEEVAKKIARLEVIINSYRMILTSPNDVNHEVLMKAKIGLHSHTSAMEAYRDMLSMALSK